MKKASQYLFLLGLCSAISVGLYGQDTLTGEVSDGTLFQYCGLNEVVVSKSLTDGFVASADDQVVVKSSDRMILKPGFKAGNWTSNGDGIFIARIATDCNEEMVWGGEESSDWNNPKNWKLFGVPIKTDNVIIVDAPNVPEYSGTEGIKGLSMEGNALDLTTNLTVEEILSLTDGIIRAGTNTLVLGDALTVSGGSNASYVHGRISKEGTSSFSFPTGHLGFYRPISMSAPPSNGTYQAVYHEENSDDLFPHSAREDTLNAMSTTGYWEFDKVFGPDVSLSISYDQLHSCGITNVDDVQIVVWDGSQWTEQGGQNFTGDNLSGNVSSDDPIGIYGPLSISVSEAAPEILAVAGDDQSILFSQSVQLGGTPIGSGGQEPYDYRWYIGSNEIGNQRVWTLSPEESAVYELFVRDSKGCLGYDAVQVNVDPSLTIDFSDLSQTLTNDQLIIQVETDQFSEVVHGGVASFNYELNALGNPIAIGVSSNLVEEVSRFSITMNEFGEINDVVFIDTDELGTEEENIELTERYFSVTEGKIRFFLDGERVAVQSDKSDQFGLSLFQGILMTPDNDGANDVFEFTWETLPESYSIAITDFSGQLVFESTDPNSYWDGTVSDVLVPSGSFKYDLMVNETSITGQFIISY